jgi:hypothetical protein
MNKFFSEYVDLTALVLIFLTPVILTIIIKRKEKRQTRAAGVYILLFAPSGILTLMFFHLFENTYHAVENTIAGRFKYDFHFYSLILMGLVITTVAAFLMRVSWQKCKGQQFSNRRIFLGMSLIALLCLPLWPITPLSIVPVFCCFVSLTGVFFVRRKIKETDIATSHEAPVRTMNVLVS